MPYKIQYYNDGGILVKGEQLVTGKEIEELNNILYETEAKIKNISYQIIDFTGVKNISISNEEVDNISRQDKRACSINPDMLIAVISDQDVIYGLARMWEVKSGSSIIQAQVFRRHDEALQWIQLKRKTPVD
ncbi:MAG: hypothetical protein P8X42_09015 [Calditrichaceae bacterium]|jgi:hypothetical protein